MDYMESDGKWTLRKPWHKKEDIRIDRKEIGQDDVNWVYVAQDSEQYQYRPPYKQDNEPPYSLNIREYHRYSRKS
jgi:hypothetical protein